MKWRYSDYYLRLAKQSWLHWNWIFSSPYLAPLWPAPIQFLVSRTRFQSAVKSKSVSKTAVGDSSSLFDRCIVYYFYGLQRESLAILFFSILSLRILTHWRGHLGKAVSDWFWFSFSCRSMWLWGSSFDFGDWITFWLYFCPFWLSGFVGGRWLPVSSLSGGGCSRDW